MIRPLSSLALSVASFLLLTSAAVGCSSSDSSSSTNACGDTSATTFSAVKAEVLVSCKSVSCHASGSTNGGLDLVTDPYKALVNVPPDAKEAAKRGWTVPAGLMRVTPGDETKSFLYQKLTMPTATDPQLGHRMPDTGQTADACEIQKVRDWIRRGAPND